MNGLATADNKWDGSAYTGSPCCPRFVDAEGDRWTLRPAGEHDLDRVVALYDDFGPADRSMGIPPATDHRRRSWIETLLAEGHNIVAEGAEGLVGHVVYTPAEDDRPELAVFVHPNRQNRGIGTELCAQAAAAAVDADRTALELHVDQRNRAAVAVYRRLGFEVVNADQTMQMALELDESVAATVCSSPAERS
ncbi:MAG: acetyltransferase [Halonotius sp. J07HN4]|nr:MAG: acetyltransferase [Halonotius sp. J07HN4]